MITTLIILGYLLVVAALSWVESKLIKALNLGGNWGGMIYAVIANLISSVVAPVALVATAAAGFIGVFAAINNPKHISGQEAFGTFAMPVAFVALGILVVVRVLPLLLMNLRSPIKALLYSVLSTVVLSVLFTIAGLAVMATLPSDPPPATTPATTTTSAPAPSSDAPK